MAELTLDTARKILDAAFAKATELKLKRSEEHTSELQSPC